MEEGVAAMRRQEVRGFVVAFSVALATVGMAQAQETGLAGIHSWVKMGRRTCMADHFHSGNGNGASRSQAERAAIQSWVDFTAWEYGDQWGRYALAASKKMSCEQGSGWNCFVEARPCRSF